MDDEINMDNVQISYCDEAPPIQEWLAKEMERMIMMIYNKEVKITFTSQKDPE